MATDIQMTQVRNIVQNPKTTVKQMGVILADFISREAGRRTGKDEVKADHVANVVLEVLAAAEGDLWGRGLNPLSVQMRMNELVTQDLINSARGNLYDNAHDCGWDGDGGAEPQDQDEKSGKEQYDAAEAPDRGNETLAYVISSHTMTMLMEDVQANLRERLALPEWNPLFGCEDMIGDTDGLTGDETPAV